MFACSQRANIPFFTHTHTLTKIDRKHLLTPETHPSTYLQPASSLTQAYTHTYARTRQQTHIHTHSRTDTQLLTQACTRTNSRTEGDEMRRRRDAIFNHREIAGESGCMLSSTRTYTQTHARTLARTCMHTSKEDVLRERERPSSLARTINGLTLRSERLTHKLTISSGGYYFFFSEITCLPARIHAHQILFPQTRNRKITTVVTVCGREGPVGIATGFHFE